MGGYGSLRVVFKINMKKALSIFSSGLDSSVATALAMKKHDVVLGITFDYGQKAAKREIEFAKRLASHWDIEHIVIDIAWMADETSTALVNKNRELPEPEPQKVDSDAKKNAADVWVPGRNALFCTIAASYAESRNIPVIIAGFNAEEAVSFPDNSTEFLNRVNALFAYSSRIKIKLESPTINMTKADIAKKLPELNISPDQIWPCYRGGEKLCGRCESCVRTIRAFKQADKWKLIEGRFE